MRKQIGRRRQRRKLKKRGQNIIKTRADTSTNTDTSKTTSKNDDDSAVSFELIEEGEKMRVVNLIKVLTRSRKIGN